jgi:hypothetical protein
MSLTVGTPLEGRELPILLFIIEMRKVLGN